MDQVRRPVFPQWDCQAISLVAFIASFIHITKPLLRVISHTLHPVGNEGYKSQSNTRGSQCVGGKAFGFLGQPLYLLSPSLFQDESLLVPCTEMAANRAHSWLPAQKNLTLVKDSSH